MLFRRDTNRRNGWTRWGCLLWNTYLNVFGARAISWCGLFQILFSNKSLWRNIDLSVWPSVDQVSHQFMQINNRVVGTESLLQLTYSWLLFWLCLIRLSVVSGGMIPKGGNRRKHNDGTQLITQALSPGAHSFLVAHKHLYHRPTIKFSQSVLKLHALNESMIWKSNKKENRR